MSWRTEGKGLVIEHCSVARIDLSKANLTYATLRGDFQHAFLGGSFLTRASLESANFT